jgi:hypothetical protein
LVCQWREPSLELPVHQFLDRHRSTLRPYCTTEAGLRLAQLPLI